MGNDNKAKKSIKKSSTKEEVEIQGGDEATPHDQENVTDTNYQRGKEEDNAEDAEDDEDEIITDVTFESLGVNEEICKAVKSLGWTFASRIQKETLPHALQGRDVIGLAETGSGKTGSFVVPILQSLLENPQRNAVYAVILAPTRELAFQIHDVASALGGTIGASCVCIVGGVDQASQSIALARNPHIVTATPGRLVDHLTNTKGFHLRKLKYLVMDEADRMLR